jgi:hypothetical protein
MRERVNDNQEEAGATIRRRAVAVMIFGDGGKMVSDGGEAS